jgi:hypothetical protein
LTAWLAKLLADRYLFASHQISVADDDKLLADPQATVDQDQIVE